MPEQEPRQDEYRRRASEARRMAELSRDTSLRDAYETLALQWERLARALEQSRRW